MQQDGVKLKNGSEEFGPLVNATMISLRHLIADDPIAFYELRELCRNPSHKLFGHAGEKLVSLALIERDGVSIHSSIKNVVLSAVEGEMLEMHITSPFAEGDPQ